MRENEGGNSTSVRHSAPESWQRHQSAARRNGRLLLAAVAVSTLVLAGCSRPKEAVDGSPATASAGQNAPGSQANSDGLGNTSGQHSVASNGLVLNSADSSLMLRADEGRLMGNPGAMWVVMISDYQCPYCKGWHDSSMTRFEREYVRTGKVRFAYIHLPLVSIHPHALIEAEAAMCASAQDKFWPFSDALFVAQKDARILADINPVIDRIAEKNKLDMDAFRACQRSPAIKALVNADIQQAQRAGVQATPTFVIGQFLVPGAVPWADFSQAVDSALVLHRLSRAAASQP